MSCAFCSDDASTLLPVRKGQNKNIGYMFRPNIRSSSGLRQTKSFVLCVYWDPNMFDSRKNTSNFVSIFGWIKCVAYI